MSVPAIDISKLAPEERLKQKAELDRRLDSLDSGIADVISWDEAKRRLRS